MSALISISIDLNKIDKSKIIKGKNGGQYYDITLSVNDEVNQYGQNVSVFDTQTAAERSNKADKKYLGNGKVFWNNGKITNAEKKDAIVNEASKQGEPNLNDMDDSLPF